ncbi:SOS response-associated peptidase [Ilyomonas limi]|uniref:Abasic site processing protein n=1 Tax=Ilyomonas limi TaxID=2575867 RepID=A0A4U3KWK3_9BACT|nr:SOS response-associated peptidase family protein [Ilyomonas limi]TKK65427.1 SOS response-associated peptidase [Ilyomonas limi]
MCYYNGQKVTREEFIRLKQLEKAIADFDFLNKPLQIGFDYSANAVLKRYPDKEDFDIVQMEWGFIPHYMKTRSDVLQMRNGYYDKDKNFRPPMVTLNAVCEELLKGGKIFRDAALHRRCLVLSTGFFEWRHVFPINKRTGQPVKKAITYPYYISLKDKSYFYMAGIWQPWTDKETGEYVESFAIVTTKANKLMEQIHNTKKRMPAILNDDLAYEWLFSDLSEERILEIAATQYPSEEMQACSIEKGFREALEPTKEFMYEDLPALELAV